MSQKERKCISVRFKGSTTEYSFWDEVGLEEGRLYKVQNEEKIVYSTPIRVIGDGDKSKATRTIIKALELI